MKSCREVSRLVSESMDRELSFWERMSLWFHLGMCKLCAEFSTNLQRLRDMARRYAQGIESDAGSFGAALSDEARQRIKRALETQNL
jgi:hypothetical protein